MESCVRELEENHGVGGGWGIGRKRHRGRGGSCKLGAAAGAKRRGEARPHMRSMVAQATYVEYSQEWGRIGSLHGELRSGVRGESRRWRRPGVLAENVTEGEGGVANLGPRRGRSDAGKLVRMCDRRLSRRFMLSIFKSGEG